MRRQWLSKASKWSAIFVNNARQSTVIDIHWYCHNNRKRAFPVHQTVFISDAESLNWYLSRWNDVMMHKRGIRDLVSCIFGNKTVHRQDNSPTRVLKTVHRHIWRQFTDRFEDSSPTLLKTVHHIFYRVFDIWLENKIDYCEEILLSYDLRWYFHIICWESDILFVWLMINIQTFDCYMKLYWCDPIAYRKLFLMKFASNSKHSSWI